MKLDRLEEALLVAEDTEQLFERFQFQPPSANSVRLGRIVACELEADWHLLASYQLRYRIYCQERGFLPAEDYPDAFETDGYDALSLHFGVFLDEVTPSRLIATTRLVPGTRQFPLHRYCTVFPDYADYFGGDVRAAEISRLCMDQAAIVRLEGRVSHAMRKDILIALYKAMYNRVQIDRLTHLFAAMEPPLARIVRWTGFPFQEIGPETDYYGRVLPYMLDIAHMEQHLQTQAPGVWDFFTDGQEQLQTAKVA